MNTNSKSENKQQVPSGRRGFMRKISAAGAAIAVAAVPATAGASHSQLTNRQRTLLRFYEQLSDSVQLTMIDMAEEFASEPTLRRAPQFRVISGGAS